MTVGYWFEIWRRPGHAQFGRVIDDPPVADASFHVGVGLVGDGSMTLPDNYDRLHDILRIAGASSVGSLVRLRDDATGAVVGEWIPNSIDPTASKDDAQVKVGGRGINDVLNYAITEAFDWDGSPTFACIECDWIYGNTSGNMVQDPSFEQESFPNSGFEEGNTNHWSTQDGGSIQAIEDAVQAQAGSFYGLFNPSGVGSKLRRTIPSVIVGQTYTVTGYVDDLDGAGERVRLAINGATSASHTNAYAVDGIWYAELANASQGNGSTSGAWQQTTLTFVAGESPVEIFVEYLGTNDHNLAVDSFALSGAEFDLGAWVVPRANNVTINVAELSSEQAHSGLTSLKLQGSQTAYIDAFGRISYVHIRALTDGTIRLTPGRIYTSSVWVYHTAASARNFSMWASRAAPKGPLARTVAGGFLPAPGSYHMAADTRSVPPNTWTKLQWTSIADTTEVILGVAWNGGKVNVGLQHSPTFYVDDYILYPGLPATSPGEIIRRLYQHATNPNLRSPIVWENGASPGNPYLTLDFTDSLDSAGNAWTNSEVSIRIWMRMTLLDALHALEAQEGIEFRVVPNNIENGTWKLQIFNEGGMDTNPDIAILGGADDTIRRVREFRPSTLFMVEGNDRQTARASAGALATAFGRIESARLDKEGTGLDGAAAAAQQDVVNAEVANLVWSYELTNPQDAPLTVFGPGDTLVVHDPPAANGTARVWELNMTLGKEKVTWDVDLLVEEEF